jgi:cell division protein FtsL
MTHTRALALAIRALEAQIKGLNVNANLHDIAHADAPSCVEASRQRKELRAAIETLSLPKRIKEQHKAAQQEALEL